MAKKVRRHTWDNICKSRDKYFSAEATEELAVRIDALARNFRQDEGFATKHELMRIRTAIGRIEDALQEAFGRGETLSGPPGDPWEHIDYYDQ